VASQSLTLVNTNNPTGLRKLRSLKQLHCVHSIEHDGDDDDDDNNNRDPGHSNLIREISKLANLEVLDLNIRNASLEAEFMERICKLHKLKRLYLSSVKGFPANFGCLRELEILELHIDHLQFVPVPPESATSLTRLKSLVLKGKGANTFLESLPSWFPNIQSIRCESRHLLCLPSPSTWNDTIQNATIHLRGGRSKKGFGPTLIHWKGLKKLVVVGQEVLVRHFDGPEYMVSLDNLPHNLESIKFRGCDRLFLHTPLQLSKLKELEIEWPTYLNDQIWEELDFSRLNSPSLESVTLINIECTLFETLSLALLSRCPIRKLKLLPRKSSNWLTTLQQVFIRTLPASLELLYVMIPEEDRKTLLSQLLLANITDILPRLVSFGRPMDHDIARRMDDSNFVLEKCILMAQNRCRKRLHLKPCNSQRCTNDCLPPASLWPWILQDAPRAFAFSNLKEDQVAYPEYPILSQCNRKILSFRESPRDPFEGNEDALFELLRSYSEEIFRWS